MRQKRILRNAFHFQKFYFYYRTKHILDNRKAFIAN